MSRNVRIVLLCEDVQHETFGRRFLKKMGWSNHQVRVLKAPGGRGSAEQFVRKRFPEELEEHRRRLHGVQTMVRCDAGKLSRIRALSEQIPPTLLRAAAHAEPEAL